jgi:hypothetical protein
MVSDIMTNRENHKSNFGFSTASIAILLAAIMVCLSTVPASTENFSDWYDGSFIALRFDGYPSADFKEPVFGEDWGSLYTSELNFYAFGKWDIGEHGSKTWLLFNFGMLSLDFEELRTAGEYSFDRTTHISLEWGGFWQINEQYGLRGAFAPGFSSDIDDASASKSFTPEGGLHLMWFPGSGWTTGIGAVYTYNTGVPRMLPSLIAEKETDEYRVDIYLPHFADIFYKAGRGFEFGLAYEIWGDQYARDGRNFPQFEDPTLSYSVTSIGGGIGYWFDKFLYMRIDIGYLFDRRLRYMDGDDDMVVLDPEDSVYIKGYVITGRY